MVVFAAAKGRQQSFEPAGARGLAVVGDATRKLQDSTAHGFFTGAILATMNAKSACFHEERLRDQRCDPLDILSM